MRSSRRRVRLFGGITAGLCGCLLNFAELIVEAAPLPRVQPNFNLQVESEGSGTPSAFSAGLFLPISEGRSGQLFFLDSALNLSFGSDVGSTALGTSTRIGYRWLDAQKNWLFGINAGVDSTPAWGTQIQQTGFGFELLGSSFEWRANGTIPWGEGRILGNTYTSVTQAGFNRIAVETTTDQLIAIGGIDIEGRALVARWPQGKLQVVGAYYHLSGEQISGKSGFRAGLAVDLRSQVAITATISHDAIFGTQAKASLRLLIGSKPSSAQTITSQAIISRGAMIEREHNVRTVFVKNASTSITEAGCTLFSGSFDPPHEGHLDLLRSALNATDSDCGYVVLNLDSLFKPELLPYETRVAMAKLAFDRDEGFRVGEPTIDQAFKTFEWGPVLEDLRKRHPYAKFTIVMGDDVLERGVADLRPDADVFYLVASRKDISVPLPEYPIKARMIYPSGIQGCSSTSLRNAFRAGELAPRCGLPSVNSFVIQNGLYGSN